MAVCTRDRVRRGVMPWDLPSPRPFPRMGDIQAREFGTKAPVRASLSSRKGLLSFPFPSEGPRRAVLSSSGAGSLSPCGLRGRPMDAQGLAFTDLLDAWSFLSRGERMEGFRLLPRNEAEDLLFTRSPRDPADIIVSVAPAERRAVGEASGLDALLPLSPLGLRRGEHVGSFCGHAGGCDRPGNHRREHPPARHASVKASPPPAGRVAGPKTTGSPDVSRPCGSPQALAPSGR